jgi:hypothetical protein
VTAEQPAGDVMTLVPKWALMELETDPFVAAVWNCDQVLRPDHLPDPWPAMFLNDAEWFCREAGLAVIKHRRIMRLRETPRYKEVRDRICQASIMPTRRKIG